MPNFAEFAATLLQQNPNVASNPQAQALMSAIKSGDSEQGAMIARNICNTMGMSEDEALRQAKQFFGIQ